MKRILILLVTFGSLLAGQAQIGSGRGGVFIPGGGGSTTVNYNGGALTNLAALQVNGPRTFLDRLAVRSLTNAMRTYDNGMVYYVPGGSYPVEYLRDEAMMVSDRPDFFSPLVVSNMIFRFRVATNALGPLEGVVPEGVQYYAGDEDLPEGFYGDPPTWHDGIFFLYDLVHSYWKISGDLSCFTNNQAYLSNCLATISKVDNLVWLTNTGSAQGWGFQGDPEDSGFDLAMSVLYYKTLNQKAAMEAEVGQTVNASNSLRVAYLTRAALETHLWDDTYGLFQRSSINPEHHVVMSAYAVNVGAVRPELASRIVDVLYESLPGGTLALAGKGIARQGGIRYLPLDQEWSESPDAVGEYSNGAYWYFATRWVVEAVAPRWRDRALFLMSDATLRAISDGNNAVYELVEVDTTAQNAQYVVSATGLAAMGRGPGATALDNVPEWKVTLLGDGYGLTNLNVSGGDSLLVLNEGVGPGAAGLLSPADPLIPTIGSISGNFNIQAAETVKLFYDGGTEGLSLGGGGLDIAAQVRVTTWSGGGTEGLLVADDDGVSSKVGNDDYPNGVVFSSTPSTVDLTATADTTLLTVPAGKIFIIKSAQVAITADDTFTVAGTVLIKCTGGTISSTATLTAADTGKLYNLTALASGFQVAAGATIAAEVTASTAVTLTGKIMVTGYYIDE